MMLLRASLVLLICLAILAEGILLGELGRPGFDFRGHLRVIAWQLEGIREELRGFRERHGRYPTAGEGLGALDGCIGTVKTSLDPAPAYRSWFERYPPAFMEALEEIRSLPDPQDLRALEEILRGASRSKDLSVRFDPVPPAGPGPDIIITRSARVFLREDGCLLCPWLLPYVYEDRSGWPPEAIRRSPAGEAERTSHSIRVDEGIHVISPGALQLEEERFRENLAGAALFLAPLAAIAILAFLLRVATRGRIARRRRWLESAGPFVTLSAVVALLIPGTMAVRCYAASYFTGSRRPGMAARYREILDSYRDAGVLAPETHGRLLGALRSELDQP